MTFLSDLASRSHVFILLAAECYLRDIMRVSVQHDAVVVSTGVHNNLISLSGISQPFGIPVKRSHPEACRFWMHLHAVRNQPVGETHLRLPFSMQPVVSVER